MNFISPHTCNVAYVLSLTYKSDSSESFLHQNMGISYRLHFFRRKSERERNLCGNFHIEEAGVMSIKGSLRQYIFLKSVVREVRDQNLVNGLNS